MNRKVVIRKPEPGGGQGVEKERSAEQQETALAEGTSLRGAVASALFRDQRVDQKPEGQKPHHRPGPEDQEPRPGLLKAADADLERVTADEQGKGQKEDR